MGRFLDRIQHLSGGVQPHHHIVFARTEIRKQPASSVASTCQPRLAPKSLRAAIPSGIEAWRKGQYLLKTNTLGSGSPHLCTQGGRAYGHE